MFRDDWTKNRIGLNFHAKPRNQLRMIGVTRLTWVDINGLEVVIEPSPAHCVADTSLRHRWPLGNYNATDAQASGTWLT